MYQINILNTCSFEWEQLTFNDKPMVFGSKTTVCKGIKDNLGKRMQILHDNWFLALLDGSKENYEWFEKNHDKLINKVELTMHTQEVFKNRVEIEKDKQILEIIKEELQKDKILEQYYEFTKPKEKKK